ncbi:ABC transporter permease [Paenactinomyces guangxiensis]|uniref:ABC transporter permease n=1 Tax=Paenactinomyces guangxiensis TaxID=1490290 RepID=A0A7W1WSY6_9BACL|nr:ABC transporter permease [Paenactinomyces guangxiensis]MBA4495404.1 ABC transporter permease [Paenactinomyces guangxiensis]MBH8592475.1 ABC transporter permease [Paenactinomyces guangxiensis]
MKNIIKADGMKLKRTWVFWTILMTPLFLTGFLAVVYAARGDILKPHGWTGLIAWANYFLPLTVLLGITLLASMLASIEHDARSWKQSFAFPLSKSRLFISKFIWVNICLILSAILTVIGLTILGLLIQFEERVPWTLLLKEAFFPYLASVSVISIQVWLSLNIKNQAVPILIGSLGAMISLFLAYAPQPVFHLLPWAYPPLASPLNEGMYTQWAWIGIALGGLLLWIGASHFSKRELT